MAHAQKCYSHCRSGITHNGGKQADASVSAIQNQRIFKGNVGSASPPVVSTPIASVLCLLNCIHLRVCRGGFAEELLGIAPSIFYITMTGGTKEPRDFCLRVGLTNDASLMESPASDLKIGPVFLMLGHQGSLLCKCPTPWDPKNEQVRTPWVLATSPHQAGFIRIRLSKSGKNPGRMTMPSGQGAHL